MHWLNFRHLYAFWMVAHAGSFTRAAREMHVAQSAVSAQVAALEDYFEEPLLARSHRAVEVTAVGAQLLGYANNIFSHSRAINALFRDKDRLRSNQTLRVGVVGGASRNFVYRLLDEYLRRTADVNLSVSTGSYGELYQLLKKFDLDSIVSLDLPKKKDLQHVSYEKLGDSKMCIVATPAVIAEIRGKTSTAPVDVFKFRHPFEVDVLDKHVKPVVKRPLVLRMDTDDIPLLRFFANSGKGIAVLPDVGVLEDLEAGVVEAIELPRCPEVMIYGITMRPADTEGVRGTAEGAPALWSRDS